MPSDPLADLEEVYAYLKSLPPYPRSIWFIDREADYYRFTRHFLPSSGIDAWTPSDPGYSSPGLFSMPIYNWSSKEITATIESMIKNDDQEYVAPFFPFREPGIWVEMSDGNHRRLTFDQLTSPD